jgi:hypothetical protein
MWFWLVKIKNIKRNVGVIAVLLMQLAFNLFVVIMMASVYSTKWLKPGQYLAPWSNNRNIWNIILMEWLEWLDPTA